MYLPQITDFAPTKLFTDVFTVGLSVCRADDSPCPRQPSLLAASAKYCRADFYLLGSSLIYSFFFFFCFWGIIARMGNTGFF